MLRLKFQEREEKINKLQQFIAESIEKRFDLDVIDIIK